MYIESLWYVKHFFVNAESNVESNNFFIADDLITCISTKIVSLEQPSYGFKHEKFNYYKLVDCFVFNLGGLFFKLFNDTLNNLSKKFAKFLEFKGQRDLNEFSI